MMMKKLQGRQIQNKKKKLHNKKLKKSIEFKCVRIFKNNIHIFISMCNVRDGRKLCMEITQNLTFKSVIYQKCPNKPELYQKH